MKVYVIVSGDCTIEGVFKTSKSARAQLKEDGMRYSRLTGGWHLKDDKELSTEYSSWIVERKVQP